MAKAATTKKKSVATKKPVAAKKKPAVKKGAASKKESTKLMRYKCRVCGYIYSPLRGEPHNGIPTGTPFDDLPETYLCPVCGFQ
jgi:rubredoxin